MPDEDIHTQTAPQPKTEIPAADPTNLLPGSENESENAPGDIVAPEDPEPWKRVVFGIGSKQIWPAHPEPPEAIEDELTRAAVEDPDAALREKEGQHSPIWPVIFIVVIAIVALTIVFWKH